MLSPLCPCLLYRFRSRRILLLHLFRTDRKRR
nr:MAG TPA: hypothetical protein [Caudoviricetes sp.]